jgi:hypothetical protein
MTGFGVTPYGRIWVTPEAFAEPSHLDLCVEPTGCLCETSKGSYLRKHWLTWLGYMQRTLGGSNAVCRISTNVGKIARALRVKPQTIQKYHLNTSSLCITDASAQGFPVKF